MWWLVSLAWAAPRLALPAGEDPATWADAAALAGIGLGCADGADDPCVRVTVVADRWTLLAGNGTRVATVPAPRDDAARDELAWLAASLAAPLVSRRPAPAPTPAPTPAPALPPATAAAPPGPPASVAARPLPAPAPPPPPALGPEEPTAAIGPASEAAALPAAEPEAAAPDPSAPAATPVAPAATPVAPAATPVAPGPTPDLDAPTVPPAGTGFEARSGLVARAGVGVAASPGLGASPAAEVAVGALAGPAWIEAVGCLGGAAPLLALDRAYTERRADLLALGLLRPTDWLAVGAGAGASRRAWTEDATAVGAAWTPALAVEARGVVATGPVIGFVGLRAGWDARPVSVTVDGEGRGELGRWWGRLVVGGALGPRRAP